MKRAAIGYGPKGEGFAPGDLAVVPGLAVPEDALALLEKYSPDQPRVPAGSSDGGQWTDTGGSGGWAAGGDGGEIILAQSRSGNSNPRVRVDGRLFDATPAQSARISIAEAAAQSALRRVRERDPNWRPTPSITESVEGAIRRAEGEAREAQGRLLELLRDSIPNTNPDWGVNRLTKELYAQGFRLVGPARGAVMRYENAETTEQVRIMERPNRIFRSGSPQKHSQNYYYRYKPREGQPYGSHIMIPNKENE